MRFVNPVLYVAAIAVWLVAGGLTVHRWLVERDARLAAAGPPPRITEIGPAPKRSEFPDALEWLRALEAHSRKVEKALSDDASREEKMKRSSAVIEAAASQEAQALEGSQKDRVAKVIALHKDILGSLEDPDGTVRKAWAAFDKGDTGRAQRLMGLLVVNPNCDCPDLEIVLGYWEALECRVGDVMARLRRIAEWEGYEHRDLAGFLIAWSHLQIADLEAARRELEAFQAKFPDSQFREVSEKLLERIRPVARRGK